MAQKQTLILSDTLSFLSLLKLNKKLAELNPGDLIEVFLKDPETVKDLERIVNRSEDRILDKQKMQDLYKIIIIKGNKII